MVVTALPLLLERLPGLRAAPEPHEREPIFFARGFSKLLVEWDTALRPETDGKPA